MNAGEYKSKVAEDIEIGVLVDVYFMEVVGDDVVVFGHLPNLQVGEVSHVPDRGVEGVEVFLQRFDHSFHRQALILITQDHIVELSLAGQFENLAHQQHGPHLVDRDGLAEVGLLEEFAETGAIDFLLEGVDPGDGGHVLPEDGEGLLGLGVVLAGHAAMVGVEAVDADEVAAALAEEDLVAILDDMEIELPLALFLAAADVLGVENKFVAIFLEVVVDQIF